MLNSCYLQQSMLFSVLIYSSGNDIKTDKKYVQMLLHMLLQNETPLLIAAVAIEFVFI